MQSGQIRKVWECRHEPSGALLGCTSPAATGPNVFHESPAEPGHRSPPTIQSLARSDGQVTEASAVLRSRPFRRTQFGGGIRQCALRAGQPSWSTIRAMIPNIGQWLSWRTHKPPHLRAHRATAPPASTAARHLREPATHFRTRCRSPFSLPDKIVDEIFIARFGKSIASSCS